MTNYSHEEQFQMQQITENIVKEKLQYVEQKLVMKENQMKIRKFKLKIWSKFLPKRKTTSLKYMILRSQPRYIWKSQGLLTSFPSYPLT